MLQAVRFWKIGAVTRAFVFLLGSTLVGGCSLKSASQDARLSLSLPNPHRASLAQQFAVQGGGGGTAPSAWNDPSFACYGVNVTGPGIADSAKYPSSNPDLSGLLAGTTSCAYRGVVSNGFTFAANGGDTVIDLQVPPGTNRVIQLVGITNAAYCATNFLEKDGVASPGAYELGRVRADLFGDATVSIPITYTAANSISKRVDCGNGSAATVSTAPVFSFAGPYSFPLNYDVGTVAPTVTSGTIASCVVSPLLPAGLNVDSSCRIVGTPTGTSSAITYTVTATSTTGETGSADVSVAIVAGPSLSWSPLTYDFGSVSVPSASPPTKTFTLTNSGGSPATGCTVASLTDPANFTVISDSCGTSDLPAGGTCAVTVKAAPASVGAFGTTLSRNCGIGGSVSSTANGILVAGVAPVSGASLQISAGATYTTSSTVALTLNAIGATEMYVTNTAGCASGGSWEPYSSARPSWALGQMNMTATVYAKFRNAALEESACVNDTIVHDNIAPTLSGVNVNLGVGAGQNGTTAQVMWTANDANFGATPILIEASYDGGATWSILVNCPNTGTYSWTLPALAAPSARVRITATDAAGNVVGPILSSTFPILGPPTQLVFTSPITNPAEWHCVPYPMQLLDSASQPTVVAGSAVTITLSFSYGTFYSNAACTTPTGSFTVPSGQGMATAYLMPNAVGSSPLAVTATGGLTFTPPGLTVQPTLIWAGNSAAPSIVTESRYDHTLVSNGQIAMLWGGASYSSGLVQSTGSRYDLTSGTWTQTATSPLSARSGHVSVWVPSVSKFFVWGGWDNLFTYYPNGALYDPAADSWTPIATFPGSGRIYSTAFYVLGQDAVYVYGGCTSSNTCVNTLYKYSVSGNTWTPVTPSGTAPAGTSWGIIQYVPTAGALGRLVVWGGLATDGTTVSNGGSYFDVSANSWTVIPASPATAVSYPSSVVVGMEVFLFGGTDAGGNYVNGNIYRYNASGNSWTTLSATFAGGVTMPSARSEAVMAYEPNSNRVFLWGGTDTGGVTVNGGVLDLNQMKWLSNMNQGSPIPYGRNSATAVFTPNSGGQFLMWGGYGGGLSTPFSVLSL
ncbi:MAG: hypothetical protein JST04_05405 [Bdellovibrionales bacterium]|nr:hypothetical protein [Bdellovibrionales bacterium]